jgi:VIT1/CCC1 family predicted Fe2+/Mn2+ transporter
MTQPSTPISTSAAASAPAKKTGILDRILVRALDPIDRLTEAIYAVLIVMTFTMAYRAIDFNQFSQRDVSQAVISLALAAFGCAVAWGMIDGVMYVLLSMLERGESSRLLRKVKAAQGEQAGIDVLAGHMDSALENLMTNEERRQIYQQAYVRMVDNEPKPIGFKRDEFLGALGVMFIAIVVTFPVLIPLVVFRHDADLALRASNVMAIFMLFLFGFQWGKYAGNKQPLRVGLLLAGLGVVMVLIAIPLGG